MARMPLLCAFAALLSTAYATAPLGNSSTRTGTDLAPQMLALAGACEMTKCNLSGLAFVMQGRTADGAPYYKASGREEYLYRDAGGARYCDGRSANAPARWVMGQGRPWVHVNGDGLHDDSRCDDHAHVDSAAAGVARPPAAANWRMQCGAGPAWQEVPVTLREVKSTTPAVVFVSSARGVARARARALLLPPVLLLLCLVAK